MSEFLPTENAYHIVWVEWKDISVPDRQVYERNGSLTIYPDRMMACKGVCSFSIESKLTLEHLKECIQWLDGQSSVEDEIVRRLGRAGFAPIGKTNGYQRTLDGTQTIIPTVPVVGYKSGVKRTAASNNLLEAFEEIMTWLDERAKSFDATSWLYTQGFEALGDGQYRRGDERITITDSGVEAAVATTGETVVFKLPMLKERLENAVAWFGRPEPVIVDTLLTAMGYTFDDVGRYEKGEASIAMEDPIRAVRGDVAYYPKGGLTEALGKALRWLETPPVQVTYTEARLQEMVDKFIKQHGAAILKAAREGMKFNGADSDDLLKALIGASVEEAWVLLCSSGVFAAHPDVTEIVVDGEVVVLVWDNPYDTYLGVDRG